MNRQRLWILTVLLTLVCGCSFSEPTPLEIAQGHIGQAQWELALGSSDTLIRTDPNNHLGYLIHGRANLALNHLEAAIADLTRAIRLAPKEPEAYYQRALAYETLGQPNLATADRQAAQRRDPNFAIAFAYAEIQSPVVTETDSDKDDRSPISTSAAAARSSDADAKDDDAQWSAAMLPLFGDDPGQDDPQQASTPSTASSAKGNSSLAPPARKTNVPFALEDSDRPLKKVLARPHDFFGNPAHRFRPANHLAGSHKRLRPTGRAINAPGTFNSAAITADTIRERSAQINRGKYPIARWQAPGMSPAAGRSASGLPGTRLGVARRGSLKKCATAGLPGSAMSKPLQNTAGQASSGTQIVDVLPFQRGRSKFKPVIVIPRRLPPSNSALDPE